MSNKVKVFIEGEVLVLDHFSGIGHYTASLLGEVDKLLETKEFSHISIEIGLPFKLRKRINKFNYKNFTFRNMLISPRLANGLKIHRLIPPIDLLFGKKVYVFPHFSSWPTIWSPQIPIIYDLSFIHYPEFSAKKNQQFLVQQTQLSINRATRVITISDNSRKEIAKHYTFPEKLIDKVVPVLDGEKFQPKTTQQINEVRAKYGIFDNYVLFVGNIEPRKNLVSLLKAYEELPKELQKKYTLLLVGAKGWRDSDIHKQITALKAKGLKIIQPSSYVEDADLPAIFSGAKAFAYVSVYEGYGIPPVEAMACGTPVVSSNNSSLPEAVENAALMVDALNIKEITLALKGILSNETVSSKLIRKGLSRVEKLDAPASARLFLRGVELAQGKKGKSK